MKWLFLSLTILSASCDLNKEYTYITTVQDPGAITTSAKEAKVIKKGSDSAAYLDAFRTFCIEKKVYYQMAKDMGAQYLSKPLSFSLVNSKGDEISEDVISIAKRDSILFTIESDIMGMSNSGIVSSYSKSENRNVEYDSGAINRLKPYFNIKKDEFDPNGRTWYKPKSAPEYANRNGLYCYFMVQNGVASNFILKLQYHSDDWLFIKKCQFSIDEKAFELIPLNVKRDNGDGGFIWEWFDEKITSSEIDLVESLANAKQAKVKLIGSDYYDIKAVSKDQAANIKRSLDLFRALGGKFD